MELFEWKKLWWHGKINYLLLTQFYFYLYTTNTEVTNLSHFAIIFRKSHCPPQCTWQLVSEQRVLCIWVDLRLSSCGQQHPKCERTIRVVYPFFFCNFCSSSNPTNKNLKELDLEVQTAHFDKHSELGTRLCKHFIAMPDIIKPSSQILTFPTESSCIMHQLTL